MASQEPGYLIAFGHEVMDRSKLVQYWEGVESTHEGYGAEFLVGFTPFEKCEGDQHISGIVVVKFPSLDKAKEWYNSPAYAKIRELRFQGAKVTLVLAQGGVLPIEQRLAEYK
ncbi:hypothetical protein ACRE_044240 [Hapsidospora chrysogenum ATCC 11550]|uniref:DUF1330 domain-containing protein n=1 Tax=Hapsidospora chrysogenum (strain ATCC 11550 / CBS 779.69 / DSM 880 / IAM 14645 / JCM 23072 / IMI 49137) TaxID=857340 RepID=A0A086T614_HAPC1|nr:hypothetical protein ACRE_044240 [Hapsidospora chrysogenum ATCC 11550]